MHLKGYSFLLLVATFLALPLTANAQSLTRADGSTEAGPYVEVNHGPIALRGGDEVSITHSEVPDFLEGGGVACAGPTGAPTYTTDNQYFRLFDLTEFGITDDVTVTDLDMGLRVTLNGNPPQATTLNFWAVDGDFVLENLTLLGTVEYEVTDEMSGDAFIANIPIDGVVVPGGSTFAVEWFTPTGAMADTGLEADFDLRYGQNSLGQTGPTYLASTGCSITEPTTTDDIGFPDLHWVLVVNGVTGAVSNEDGATAQTVSLGQNYPNPVVGRTTVPFSLERAEQVRVSVVDALGREVLVAADETFAAGPQTVELDLSGLPSGIYVYRVATATETFSQKLVVMQ